MCSTMKSIFLHFVLCLWNVCFCAVQHKLSTQACLRAGGEPVEVWTREDYNSLLLCSCVTQDMSLGMYLLREMLGSVSQGQRTFLL